MGREILLTRVGITVTASAFVAFAITIGLDVGEHPSGAAELIEAAVYLVLVSLLVYGAMTYQVARLGWVRRSSRHSPRSRAYLQRRFDQAAPRVLTLIPSFREELGVLRQALLSAALQDYPNRRVALLIDDPPNPDDRSDAALLAGARALPGEVHDLLREPDAACEAVWQAFEHRRARRSSGDRQEQSKDARTLAQAYDRAATWLENRAASEPAETHTDRLFVHHVLREPARAHRDTAGHLRRHAARLSEAELVSGYRRVRRLFRAELSAFERKRYVNLSHAPNKAMNLNSYIGLLGHRVREREAPEGLRLDEAGPEEPGKDIDDVPYVLTLDADSVLLPDYTARLVEVMERPGGGHVAVAQTPYSAVPGSPGLLERVAGATTDMQYIVHQGFTHHDATFWVGANALLRKEALDDIVTRGVDPDGRQVVRYIQDRTVIEDTESSVDLAEQGWRLFNYPDRLSYSATPPDYGALVIQRRRWANGGLLILPKLLRHLLRRPRRIGEAWMRVHYLTSIASANVAFLALLLFPFDDRLATLWLPLTALPYFLLYGRDLRRRGYRRGDLVRVYALNVLLLAANLGGVAKSLHQAVTGRQTPFKRTPKISGRTPVPTLYVALPYLVAAYLSLGVAWDVTAERWSHAGVALVNLLVLLYGIARFIGWGPAREDLFRPLTLPPRAAPRAAQ